MRQVKATANCECRAAAGSLCPGRGMLQEQDSPPGYRPDEVYEVPTQPGAGQQHAWDMLLIHTAHVPQGTF